MILIFVPHITKRATFTFNHIFGSILSVQFDLTSDYERFESFSGAKFSYSDSNGQEFLNFPLANSILFESSITDQKIEFVTWNDFDLFFPVKNGPLSFDPFAVAFYLLSRYEEYLPSAKDTHGRYRYQESVAYKGGFLELPIIEVFAYAIKNILLSRFPQLIFPKPHYTFTSTIDIDNAYAYKHKGVLLNATKLVLALLCFRFKDFIRRFKVVTKLEKDPYDSYDKQIAIHNKYSVNVQYFVLLGDKTQYDRNLRYSNKAMQKLIAKLKRHSVIGLHPSYGSNRLFKQLVKEKNRLEAILNTAVIHSRQHYIKLELPKTYHCLIEAGVKEDFSMGYPAKGGFRAGTSHAFYFFDLERNIQTGLLLHPFVFMDTTMKDYSKIRSKDVLSYVRRLSQPVKKYGGNLIFIFHNESIGGQDKWKNWSNIYEEVILELANQENND
jgi:hypothetical protein